MLAHAAHESLKSFRQPVQFRTRVAKSAPKHVAVGQMKFLSKVSNGLPPPDANSNLRP